MSWGAAIVFLDSAGGSRKQRLFGRMIETWRIFRRRWKSISERKTDFESKPCLKSLWYLYYNIFINFQCLLYYNISIFSFRKTTTLVICDMESFNNYVEKTRWVGRWSIQYLILSTFRMKNVHVEVGRYIHSIIEWPLWKRITKDHYHLSFIVYYKLWGESS